MRGGNDEVMNAVARSALTAAQIADIRDVIEGSDLSPGSSQEEEAAGISGPMLLDGGQATYDLPTVLLDLPPRQSVDKIVYRYFNSAEQSIGESGNRSVAISLLTICKAILHSPTFQAEVRA